jgi:3-methylfumaryl-CoA hydratase
MSETWNDWIGRKETVTDTITPVPAMALAAILDRPPFPIAHGDLLPLPWHWVYGIPLVRQSEFGSDGHPKRGRFLPPIRPPRRIWVGSRIASQRPLRIGEQVERVSTIESIETIDGRSGTRVIVRLHHAWRPKGDDVALEEWQELVYCDPPPAGDVPHAPAAPVQKIDWSRMIKPDTVLLMRYSALTFNAHRIHYDLAYATGVEGYPALVVHRPLLATLLLDALQRARPGASIRGFTFEDRWPLFHDQPFTVNGRDEGNGRFALWAASIQGELAMQATAELG